MSMKAATVIGPPPRITSAIRSALNPQSEIPNPQSSVFFHRDERLAIAPPHDQLCEVARLDLLQLVGRFLRRRDRFAIDREDHVARSEHARSRTVGIDVRDDGATLA